MVRSLILWFGMIVNTFIFFVSTNAQSTSSSNVGNSIDLTLDEKTYKADCKSYTYKDMLRRPDLEGAKVQVKGRVSQTFQDGDIVFLNLFTREAGISKGISAKPIASENVFIYYQRKNKNEIRFLKEDVIIVWGTLLGLETYTNVVNSEMTAPVIIMTYYEILE